MASLFCSCIIATVGRSTLNRAVSSVLSQSTAGGDYEVIIVNDSGKQLPEDVWRQSEKVQVINTNHRERSVARNTGASLAKGHFLHFLDDDDWLASGAYQHFWELSHSTSAKWLYGMSQLLNRENEPTIVLKHGMQGNCFVQAMAGEWIPLQSSLIERNTFLRIGGFNPLLSGPEDIDLQRRILLEGDIAETPNIVASVIRGEEGSTTDYFQHSLLSRWARENILELPNVYQKMRISATGPFWHGRILRVYLTSTIWNLQYRRLFTVLSRIIFSIACLISSSTNVFEKEFWFSVFRAYKSKTFEKGIRDTQRGRRFDG